MGKTRYPILGWVVWQIGSRVVKRKLAQPRVKVGAAAVVALALAAAPGIRPRRRFPLLRRSRPERVPSQPPRARCSSYSGLYRTQWPGSASARSLPPLPGFTSGASSFPALWRPAP